jgi:hypothetical protein
VPEGKQHFGGGNAHLGGLCIGDAFKDINGDFDNFIGKLLGKVFYAGAALAASDHHWPCRTSIQQNGKVHLPLERHFVGNQQRVDRLAFRPRLFGDQSAAQHLLAQLCGFRGLDNVDAALEATGKVTQPSATGKDLRLYHDLQFFDEIGNVSTSEARHT